jgi:hypothetical protein
MNFSKLSNDSLQDLLTAKMQYSRELDAEREVLGDEIAEIEMVLIDRREKVAA